MNRLIAVFVSLVWLGQLLPANTMLCLQDDCDCMPLTIEAPTDSCCQKHPIPAPPQPEDCADCCINFDDSPSAVHPFLPQLSQVAVMVSPVLLPTASTASVSSATVDYPVGADPPPPRHQRPWLSLLV